MTDLGNPERQYKRIEEPLEGHAEDLTCIRVMNSTASPTVSCPSATPCKEHTYPVMLL